MAKKIKWNENGWTTVQEADAQKHVLEVSCRSEAGKVVEVRIRHNDGEEQAAKVTVNGEAALPMDINDFQTKFENGSLELK